MNDSNNASTRFFSLVLNIIWIAAIFIVASRYDERIQKLETQVDVLMKMAMADTFLGNKTAR